MKLISVGTDRNLFVSGSEVRERQLVLAEEREQTEIIVFALRRLGLTAIDLSPKLRIIPTNSRSRWLYVWDTIRIGKKLTRPDLVTAQDPFECGWVAWRLARYFQTGLELQIHTDFLNPYFARQSLLNRIRVQLAKSLLPRADNIRVVSQRISNSLKAGDWKLKAVPTVEPVKVDLEKIKNAPIKTDLHQKYPQFDKIILMASRLTWEKNIEAAIKMMTELVKKRPKTGLLIVGSGPLGSELKLKAESWKLTASVLFESWTDDLPSYYKTADLFLLTSHYEGYGRTIVEAQAAGCPVVSTDVGIAREAGAVLADDTNLAQVILNELDKS